MEEMLAMLGKYYMARHRRFDTIPKEYMTACLKISL